MRKAMVIGLLVLASILLGALAAGTPVAGNDSVAAVTAGINLGTAPVARTAPTAAISARVSALRALLTIIRTAFEGAAVLLAATLLVDVPGGVRSLLRGQARTRRGPPALA